MKHDPHAQADGLFDLIQRYGVAEMKKTVGEPWHPVIGVYAQVVDTKHANNVPYRDAAVAAMAAKIVELGL